LTLAPLALQGDGERSDDAAAIRRSAYRRQAAAALFCASFLIARISYFGKLVNF
jgi:hypothetical protein